MRPCIEARCPRLTRGTRCPFHQAAWLACRRANYGSAHVAMRDELAATLPAPCFYCGLPVTRATFVAAHVVDGDPASPRVGAHRSCNERAKQG